MALIGLGLVWLVSLAFYAVGRSEDRERAAEEAAADASRADEPPRAPRRRAPERRRDHD